MNRELATHILRGLVERAQENRKSTFLSEAELDAVRVLLGERSSLEGDVPDQADDAPPEIPTLQVCWKQEVSEDTETRACLDFGTSYSKAFACVGDDPDETPGLVGIKLSRNADGNDRFLLPSELIVHERSVHFGRSARKVFNDVAAEQERLIDNPKQFITLSKDVSKLEKISLSRTRDPERRFSERDALVLYLAHLVRMFDVSLERDGHSNSMPLRYTHPAWKKDVAVANEVAMKRIVAEAIALARQFPGEFEESIETRRASSLLVAARSAEHEALPFGLIEETVLEATAAGAGALMDARPSAGRQHFVILDIGAGTTDVAGCICVRKSDGRAKVWELANARGAKGLAGNVIDNALRKHILERSSLAQGSPEYVQADRELRKSIRTVKESLFNEGFQQVELVTDEMVDVERDTFLDEQTIRSMFEEIKEMVRNAAFANHEKGTEVFLVPTGGGASLPLVDELAATPVERDGARILLKLRPAMPSNLQETYADLEPNYPQLAVAIGGAHPALPEQLPFLDSFTGDPGPKTLGPIYKS